MRAALVELINTHETSIATLTQALADNVNKISGHTHTEHGRRSKHASLHGRAQLSNPRVPLCIALFVLGVIRPHLRPRFYVAPHLHVRRHLRVETAASSEISSGRLNSTRLARVVLCDAIGFQLSGVHHATWFRAVRSRICARSGQYTAANSSTHRRSLMVRCTARRGLTNVHSLLLWDLSLLLWAEHQEHSDAEHAGHVHLDRHVLAGRLRNQSGGHLRRRSAHGRIRGSRLRGHQAARERVCEVHLSVGLLQCSHDHRERRCDIAHQILRLHGVMRADQRLHLPGGGLLAVVLGLARHV